MSSSQTQLAKWRARIRSLENECFWPGPRPMEDSRWSQQLIGRDDQAHNFSDLVRETSLVVLNGESGVGKSSMLNLGIVPRLEQDGFQVIVCRNWASEGVHEGLVGIEAVEQFLATKFDAAHRLPEDVPNGPGFTNALNAEYGDEAVIILDQFESLIRHQPRFYNEVRRWIEDTVKRYAIHVVISLRTEFVHRIRDLVVGPYKRADFTLDRINDERWIAEILEKGNRIDGVDAPTIDPDAAKSIVALWTQAGGGSAWTSVGLLHLQALLYVLWRGRLSDTIKTTDTLWERDGAPVSLADFEGASVEVASQLFSSALAHAVGLRLDRCRDVYLVELAGDQTLVEGVISLLTRMPDHLESGGYKVSQERRQLAAKVLSRELDTLRVREGFDSRTDAGQIFTDFARRVGNSKVGENEADWLVMPRSEIVTVDSLRERIADRPGESDDNEVTSGPMFGLPPLAVVAEELRRYFFALAWLEESDIVVPTDADGGETMLELVHDGFSRGLKEWASSKSDGPARAPHRLTAAVGEVFDWSAFSDGAEQTEQTVNANLRWRSCRVAGMDFRLRVFVNCDFRETIFDSCTFEGVAFVNCLLDGVSFVDCEIRGDVSTAPSEWEGEKPELPSFEVEAPAAVETMNRYLDHAVETTTLGSWTSGRPARPISSERLKTMKTSTTDAFRWEKWEPQTGGLVMYGGRLSSLMFAACIFADGTISLRHVAGTSLEFAEQVSGSIELYDVAIRGVSVSPPVGRKPQDTDSLEVRVLNSALQSVWFSTPLRGSASIVNSVVWQLFNASTSDSAGFSVQLENSPNLGAVNARIWQDSKPFVLNDFESVVVSTHESGHAEEDVDFPPPALTRARVATFASKVDYQSLKNLRGQSPEPPQE